VDGTAKILDSTKNLDASLLTEEQHILLKKTYTRFGTYKILSTSASYWETWQDFRRSNMISNIQMMIAKKDIRGALILWRRHCIGMVFFTPDEELIGHLSSFLNEIPHNLAISSSLLILDEFRSSVDDSFEDVDALLEHVELIFKWCISAAETIEQIYDRPKDSVSILEWALKSAVSQYRYISPKQEAESVHKRARLRIFENSDSIKIIKTLLFKLKDLVFLYEMHEFKMTLNEYECCTQVDIAVRIMLRIHCPKHIKKHFVDNVKPYINKHSISDDSLLQEYCKALMENRKGTIRLTLALDLQTGKVTF
jgi:hypothetical protein